MLTTEEVTSIPPTQLTSIPFQHAVKFYIEDADLYVTLAEYVRQAVGDGQGVLIVATPEHWRGLAQNLSSSDLACDAVPTEHSQLEGLLERGQLVFVDAEEARQEMMVKGEPSPARFEAHFEALIDQMNDAWPGVHVYEEAGDLLAGDAQFGPMRQLEQMWNGCRRDTAFGLLSGYCLEHFSEPADGQSFDNLCDAHTQVFAAGDSGGAEVARWQRHTTVLNRRLNQKREALEQAQKELEHERERHRKRSEYLGKFAHELRNPMAPVLCAVEMMNLRGDDTTKRERGIIERQVSRMVGLVDDFLDVTRVVFERTEMQKSRVEVQDVVRLATGLAQASIEDRGHRLHVDVASSGLSLEADPDRLAEALAQLLENAAMYTPEGGNIWVEARREAGSVAVSVRDDGPGIDASLLDNVFDIFVQGEVDAPIEGRGMGTGLAITRKITELHGGAVGAFSKNGSDTTADETGSEFVMRLPLAFPKEHRSNVSRLKKGEIAGGGQVLVVDDNEDFASMLSDTLDLLGHEVRVAHDAGGALAMLDDFWPDVALLDINLPGMTGHELAERIKQHSDKRGVCRLVALTGYGDERKRKRSEEMGFDAHLVKPIVLSQLQQTLDQVLDE